MFTDFFYLLRLHGMKVSFNEWMTLMEALEKGLHQSSLTGFYYLARAILVKTEADFDKFDGTFLEYFRDVEQKEIPKELLDWLSKPKEQKEFSKEDVDAAFGGMSPEDIRKMLEQRLKEQTERHDGGNHWVGTGGTSLFGNSGYNPNGFRVGGESTRRSALQVAAERNYRDFREDKALEMRQFQMAFRRLRQFSTKDTGPKDVLDLDATIRETCDNAGSLSLVFGRPRKNTVKLLMLFDSGGSMWPYSQLCTQLFQSAVKSNHFKDLKVWYFHNCFYDYLYNSPSCYTYDSVNTEWVLDNIKSDYKVIVVGDASMAPYELLSKGGCNDYYHYNETPGIDWIRRVNARYEKMIWLNPTSPEYWERGYGSETVKIVKNTIPMYHLSVSGLEAGLKYLISGKQNN